MSLNDPLANALLKILVKDKQGIKEITLDNNSKLIKSVLKILNENNYIGTFEEVATSKGGRLTVNLLGNINKCGVIKPKFNVKVADYQKFEKRYLPAYGFGFLIVSTNQGLITQEQAIKKNLGGRLLAYVY